MNDWITAWDLAVGVIFLLIIVMVSKTIVKRNIDSQPFYKYYIPGLMAKLAGGTAVCLIYAFYYGGGDTHGYYYGGMTMIKIMGKDFDTYLSIMGGDLGGENYSVFDGSTGWPRHYMWKDAKTFFVIRFVNPLLMLSGGTYVGGTILLAWLSYFGIWRLYILFSEQYPILYKQLAIAILFMPSVVFWGSGMLKDTITFSAVCWFASAVYQLVVKRKQVVLNVIFLVVSSYLMIAIKPYIFLAVLPGALVWVSHEKVQSIKSTFLKVVIGPTILLIAFGAIGVVMSQVQDSLGVYSSVDNVLETATITREDMIRADQYGDNFFDIGTFEPTVGGLLSKAPVAITAALYRPFLWEANNPVMLLSALENTFVLLLTIFLLFRIRPFAMLSYIGSQPLLLFSLSFAIIFAFAVGLTTANFGAMVRYKIPCIPFMVASLLILYNYYQTQKGSSS